MNLVAFQGFVMVAVSVAMFVASGFAFIDAATRRADAYVAADKLTKPAWLIILGLGVAINILGGMNPLSFLKLIAIVAALVYLVDVRPVLQTLTRR